LRGSGRFPRTRPPDPGVAGSSQSPSLQGSGRFLARSGRETPVAGLNPLHCGAVVASGARRQPARRPRRRSQSPSLRGSGRFSLPGSYKCLPLSSQSPSLRGSGRFGNPGLAKTFGGSGLNPLHCGAVVASGVNIYISGQLYEGLNPLHCGAVVASVLPPQGGRGGSMSQSPSLRGSGRFPRRMAEGQGGGSCLNPLHCGAVVASPPRVDALLLDFLMSQSPSLRGSGRFPPRRTAGAGKEDHVSIPFIAGQWSLRTSSSSRSAAPPASQSPSLRGSGRFTF